MHINAFIEKPEEPTGEELAAALGAAREVWDRLVAELNEECGILTQEWLSYSRKAGWAMRLKSGKRTILYLCPYQGCFLTSFALGDRAVAAAREAGLPKQVVRTINESKKYVEGTAVRMVVATAADIPAIRKLATIKIEH